MNYAYLFWFVPGRKRDLSLLSPAQSLAPSLAGMAVSGPLCWLSTSASNDSRRKCRDNWASSPSNALYYLRKTISHLSWQDSWQLLRGIILLFTADVLPTQVFPAAAPAPATPAVKRLLYSWAYTTCRTTVGWDMRSFVLRCAHAVTRCVHSKLDLSSLENRPSPSYCC